MTPTTNSQDAVKAEVSKLFGLYKAEWLNGQLFELFAEPEYFDELRIKKPCVLTGGRGTGKTTVLRGLSYEGQFAMSQGDVARIDEWGYYGLYYRVNTNRVAAFKGPELSDQQWIRCFAHYMNLVFCDLLLEFVQWYCLRTSKEVGLSVRALRRVQESLHLPPCGTIAELADHLESARDRFEASINNVADAPPADLSMQSAPVDALADALVELDGFRGRQFFFLLDEYENFEDYQQRVVNTLIKQARPSYTFKVGVRELGWREKATLNINERLTHPADYVSINIREKFDLRTFRDFAARVCNDRLARSVHSLPGIITDIREVLPELSDEEEAKLLGVGELNEKLLRRLEGETTQEDMAAARRLPATMLHLLNFWSDAGNGRVADLLHDAITDPDVWRDRYNNYIYSALFTIRRGKRGIRKYYAGWEVLTHLADGNIRFLLELVHQSYLRHFDDGGRLGKQINPKHQTEAAVQVGKTGLGELEGVSVEGGRLTKLLLSLGRVFQVLAETPEGHTPEATQFYLDDPTDEKPPQAVEDLLRLAVMHQALVRSAGNKFLGEADTKDFDYRIHPIFAPFFGFSYRQKRKLKLTGLQLLGLIYNPADTIKEVLEKNRRTAESGDAELPDQLRLFEGFYHGDR